MSLSTNAVRLVALALAAAWSAGALADPPPHAPAHGWRKKHDPYYLGYSGVRYEQDFGIVSGRCNREEIATVVGGAVGGYLGSRIADEHPVIGTVIGAVAGAVVGKRIGRELDEREIAWSPLNDTGRSSSRCQAWGISIVTRSPVLSCLYWCCC